MLNLGILDYALIGIYFAVLVGVGFYYRKLASASLDNYFLGGRKLPWWMLGISGMGAWLDLTGTMLITSFLFMLGPTGLFVELRGGVGLVLVFMFIYVGKWHRRSGLMTVAEWMLFRFGENKWGHFARLAQVIAMMAFGVGMLAYAVKGIGLFFSMFIPLGPAAAAATLLLITCVYTIQSGFYGVVITDVFQGLLILVGVIFVTIYAVILLQGHDLSALAYEVTGNNQWTNVWPAEKVHMPSGYEHYSYLRLVGLFFLFRVIFLGMGIGVDNRYFGASSERQCGLLGFFSGWCMLMRWPMMMGFAVLGLLLVKDVFPDQEMVPEATRIIQNHFEEIGIGVTPALWHERLTDVISRPDEFGALPAQLESLMGEHWQSSVSMLSYHGTVFPERILPAALLGMIPMGVRGVIIVALMAASMSTINTVINNTATFFTRDLYQGYLRRKAKNNELIYASWIFGLVFAAVGFVVAFYAENINEIWGWVMGGLSGGLVVPSFLRFYWWRFNGGGFAFGLLAGILGAVLQRIFFPELQEWYQFMIVVAIGFVASILGTYLTKETDRDVLEAFYKKTRPFGFWKPLMPCLDADTRVAMRREHKNDILAIPFGMMWMVSMLLLPMQMLIMRWDAIWITLIIFVISLLGLYKFWYKNLS